MAKSHQILVGLGGNLNSPAGRPIETIRAAIRLLGFKGLKILDVSSFFETEPVPVSDQPDFINCALRAETLLPATALLLLFQEIEKTLGRKAGERWCARTLDIDLLGYGESIFPDRKKWQAVVGDANPAATLDEPVVPHPRLHKRAFVLLPLLDIAPDWVHPVEQKSIAELAHEPIILQQRGSVRKVSDNL